MCKYENWRCFDKHELASKAINMMIDISATVVILCAVPIQDTRSVALLATESGLMLGYDNDFPGDLIGLTISHGQW
jgi:hypothetical protein